jgi:hypothetical protein
MPQYPVKSVAAVIGFAPPVPPGGGGITQPEADARYLQLAGGTVTGDLNVNGAVTSPGNLAGAGRAPGTINARQVFSNNVELVP